MLLANITVYDASGPLGAEAGAYHTFDKVGSRRRILVYKAVQP